MISGSVTIQDNIITSIDLIKDGVGNLNDFQKLILLRDMVLNAVYSFEKENQKKYFQEAKNAKPYEEKF